MSEESDDDIGVMSTSIKKRQRKGPILSDDSGEESEVDRSSVPKIDEEKTSENESDVEEHETTLTKSRIKASSRRAVGDEDTESSENDNAGTSDSESEKPRFDRRKISKAKKKTKNKPSSGDSSNDNGNSRANSPTTSSEDEMPMDSPNKNKKSIGSSRANIPTTSSEDEMPMDSPNKNKKSIGSNIRDNKEKKQSRKSKENAMKEIYSVSNRMLRESAVGLPYHRPRQRTLDEFLNRKKVLPDVLPVLGGIKLSLGTGQVLTSASSGSFAEEAEKILKEREKRAEEFFKEETEEEDSSKGKQTENETDAVLPTRQKELEEDKTNKQISSGTEDVIKQGESMNEQSNFDEMTRALILEEDSSDNGETENDMDNMFLPSKIVNDSMLASCKAKLQNDTTNAILNEIASKELPTMEKESVNDSGIMTGVSKESSPVTSLEDMVADSPNFEKCEGESESLRLFLEPDDDQTESKTNVDTNIDTSIDKFDLVPTGQKKLARQLLSEKNNSSLPNKFDTSLSKLGKRLDLTTLGGTLANIGSPKLGKKGLCAHGDSDDFIIFDVENEDDSKEKSNKGLDILKDRFVKHVKGNQGYAKVQAETTVKPFEMTIVSKEIDSEGREHLKTEKLNYVSNAQSPLADKKPLINFDKVRLAKKSEKIGAQHLSLKMILKQKIDQKRNEEWIKREEQRKLDNEEEDDGEDKDSVEEEEEDILDDEEMSEDSEEEEDEEIDWEDEEARLKEIDRRNKLKRIKKGSFLDDEAEDEDDFQDELDEDSIDQTRHENNREIIIKETKSENQNQRTFDEKKDLDDLVSTVIDKSISLPDTEELLEANPTEAKPVSDANDSNSTVDVPIHPMFLKANKKLSLECDDNKVLNIAESTPCSMAKERIQSDQNLNWTPLLNTSSSLFNKSTINLDESSTPARKKLGFEELFDTTDPQVDNMDDIIGLCSGQFLTQQVKAATMTQKINTQEQSQFDNGTQDICDTPDTVILTENLTAISNVTPDSPTNSKNLFETGGTLTLDKNIVENKSPSEEVEPQPGFMQDNCGALSLLTSSEDEKVETNEGDKPSNQRVKKFKKRKRMVLSDDSDENNDALSNDESDENDSNRNAEREVLYDSEENEIEANDLDMEEERNAFKGFRSKKGALRREFVEQEAELSGESNDELNISEDEDERGLDRLMLEEGDMDEECADQDKIRDQLGRLHQRALLDDDQREVRLFQEAFLEDGELHSDNARTRKFRWKDTDEDVELERRPSDDEADDAVGGTTQLDEKWRLERLEREKWIKESEIVKYNKNKIHQDIVNDNSNDEDSDKDDSQFFSLATKAMKKLQKKSHSSSTINVQKTSSVAMSGGDTLMAIANDISEHNSNTFKQFKSPKGKLPLQIVSTNSGGSVRGSFLSRCPSTLEKLAEMTKSSSEVRTGTGAKNTKNFVFAVLSPEKSKGAGADNVNSVDSSAPAKPKPKLKGNSKCQVGSHAPDSKKIKIDRTIDENSSDTIFGFM